MAINKNLWVVVGNNCLDPLRIFEMKYRPFSDEKSCIAWRTKWHNGVGKQPGKIKPKN
jgi:hypothetical protein